MNILDLQHISRQRNAKWHTGREWSLAEWTNAMCGEAGEAANQAKKVLRQDTGMVGQFDETRDELLLKVAKEACDTILYAILVIDACGMDVETLLRQVFNNKSEQLGFEERL